MPGTRRFWWQSNQSSSARHEAQINTVAQTWQVTRICACGKFVAHGKFRPTFSLHSLLKRGNVLVLSFTDKDQVWKSFCGAPQSSTMSSLRPHPITTIKTAAEEGNRPGRSYHKPASDIQLFIASAARANIPAPPPCQRPAGMAAVCHAGRERSNIPSLFGGR